MSMRSIVVVGGALAGLRAVEELRTSGFDGTLTVIGAEPHLPYDRPPLSKQVLAGAWEPDKAFLRPVGRDLESLEATWRTGVTARALDPANRSLELDDGTTATYDGLIIATGARVRRIPGQDGIGGVHVLRTLDDALALRADLVAGPQRVAVIGAGFIGAEVAATARGLGLEVTIIEALEAPMIRGLGATIGALCAEVHRDQGVDVRLGVGVDRFEVDGQDRVRSVVLADGTEVHADVVVVGVGVVPNTEWLQGSGLTLDDGVVCDATGAAGPDIVAAGDVARWHNPRFDEVMRLEHWDNAQEQGAHVARRLLAGEAASPATHAYEPVPWFWSDQYDRKIQMAGRVRGDDAMVVVDGSLEERRFTAIYGRAGRLTGVLAFNRPRLVMQYRAMIESGASWDEALAHAKA